MAKPKSTREATPRKAAMFLETVGCVCHQTIPTSARTMSVFTSPSMKSNRLEPCALNSAASGTSKLVLSVRMEGTQIRKNARTPSLAS